MSGHVFVVHGDLLLLECDAWLLPTDASMTVEEGWRAAVRLPDCAP